MKYFISLLLTLSFLALLLFRDIPQLYFFSDDFIWLLNAKRDTVVDLPRYFVDAEGFFYRPVTKIYFWMMWQLVQDTAFWYHVVNILFHFVISTLVYAVSFKLISRVVPSKYPRYATPLMAFGSAVLFFVHPVHLESIVWMSVITELIPALCVMMGVFLTMVIYDLKVRWLSIPVIALFVVGLGGHEYMVVFPVLVYFTHLYLFATEAKSKLSFGSLWSEPLKKYSILYLVLLLCEVGYFVLRWIANSHWSGGDYSYNLARLPFNFVGNTLGYVGLLIVGTPFVQWYFDLRFFLREQLLFSFVLLGVVVLVVILIGKWIWQYKNSQAFYFSVYCVGFFFVSLSPFIGLGGLAERYVYLPSFNMLLLFAYGVFCLSQYIEQFTESVADVTAYALLIGIFAFYFIFSLTRDIQDWEIASVAVVSRLDEFRFQCDTFTEGETLVRVSPENRIGRAWFFQVGYEEGANLYCDKNLRILRK